MNLGVGDMWSLWFLCNTKEKIVKYLLGAEEIIVDTTHVLYWLCGRTNFIFSQITNAKQKILKKIAIII